MTKNSFIYKKNTLYSKLDYLINCKSITKAIVFSGILFGLKLPWSPMYIYTVTAMKRGSNQALLACRADTLSFLPLRY